MQESPELMDQRTISIIIPVRNQPETLEALLAALDVQICPEGWGIEVVCVDNNSTDHTAEVIRRHNAIYLLEMTLGPSIARNTGASASIGELLWFIDADAVPLGNDFVSRIIQTADELGDYGGFGGPILLPDSQKNNPIAFADHMACWSAWNAWRPTGHSGFQPTSIVIPRAVFEMVGGYDTELRVLEDWDLQLRIERSRQLTEGPDAPMRPIWFIDTLAVAHSARSSLMRTFKHSWYWGLPSREGWLERSGVSAKYLERPVLRWFGLPRLFLGRAVHPLQTAWRVSRWRAVICLPFLLLTLLVWSIAVIVGKGQPEDNRIAPV
jgi:glycosyltransferase involved in cell wall biosynthesis